MNNLQTLLKRVRAEIDRGAGSAGSRADRATVIRLLNEALAAAMLSMMHYRRQYFMARGIRSQKLAKEFMDRSNEELGHADLIAERITQLHVAPDFRPAAAGEYQQHECAEGNDLCGMMREHVAANRIDIDRYRDAVDQLGEADSATRQLMEGILHDEEQHAEDFAALQESLLLVQQQSLPRHSSQSDDEAQGQFI